MHKKKGEHSTHKKATPSQKDTGFKIDAEYVRKYLPEHNDEDINPDGTFVIKNEILDRKQLLERYQKLR